MIRFGSLFSVSRRFAAATLLCLFLFSGCQTRTATNAGRSSGPTPEHVGSKTPQPPAANILVDDAMLAKPYAIIGGTVENIGGARLENLSVEIELRRRDDGSTERREVAVEPGGLDPGKQGKYSLKVLSDEWGSSRVVSLREGSSRKEVVFKTEPGAKRPPEKIGGNIVIVKTPSRKKLNGEEFINTPDNPVKVP
jgi:hypothetical protein